MKAERYTTITWAEYTDLQRRAADGDLIARAEHAWRTATGEDLRTELVMLAAVHDQVAKLAERSRVRRPQEPPLAV